MSKVVADTGPLLAAADHRDRAHRLAAALVTRLGRDLIIPTPVLTETDYLMRARLGVHVARAFLGAVSEGTYSVAHLTSQLLRRAVAIDGEHADLDLGLADAAVMAIAERRRLPILTFDFRDFRAASSRRAPWRLVVTEADYAEATQ